MRKGQLIFEFVITMVLFIDIVMYVLWLLNMNVNIAAKGSMHSDLNYKAMQISDVLVKNRGNWTNIDGSMVMLSAGLADSWPLLNASKILDFSLWCSDINSNEGKKAKLGVKGKQIRIFINNTATGVNWTCGNEIRGDSGYMKRYALLKDISGALEITTVEVWVK